MGSICCSHTKPASQTTTCDHLTNTLMARDGKDSTSSSAKATTVQPSPQPASISSLVPSAVPAAHPPGGNVSSSQSPTKPKSEPSTILMIAKELHATILAQAEEVLKATNADHSQNMENLFARLLDGSVFLHDNMSVLSGLPKDTVQIFISSTFDDTKFEQDELLKNVFPFLRTLCHKLGLQFNIVSMRWGVLAKSGNNHMTSELCMSQLEQCKRISAGPAFVTIQSHRYGYRPFPSIVEKNEFEAIVSSLEANGKSAEYMRSPHWKLDESGTPQVYVLQPVSQQPGCEMYLLSDEDKARAANDADFKKMREDQRRQAVDTWWTVYFPAMQNSLREGAHLAGLPERAREKYNISVTEDEVMRGVFGNPSRDSQSFAVIRDIEGIMDAEPAEGERTLSAYREGAAEQQLLDGLKNRLKSTLPADHVMRFSVPWVGNDRLHKNNAAAPTEWKEYIESFAKVMTTQLSENILQQFKRPLPEGLLKEMVTHTLLVQDNISHEGFGRLELLNKIHESMCSCAYEKVLVLTGKSGYGKTWLMCKAINSIKNALVDAVVIYRLLGASPASMNTFSLIRSLTEQISRAYGAQPAIEVPSTWSEASDWFARGVGISECATAQRPLIIVLDSLDQLGNSYRALEDIGAWLPGCKYALPPNVRLVVSTLSTDQFSIEHTLRTFSQRVHLLSVTSLDLNSRIAESCLEAVVRTRHPVGVVLPVKRILVQAHRKEVLTLLRAQNGASPLLVSLTLDVACSWRSYESESDTVAVLAAAMRHIEDPVVGVIHLIFQRIEDLYGPILVRRILGLITISCEGLTIDELEDILSCDDVVLDNVYEWWTPPIRRLPPMLVHRVVESLGRYLVRRKSGFNETLQWFHRQFHETAFKRYCDSDPYLLVSLHTALARYFGDFYAQNGWFSDRMITRQLLTLTPSAVWFSYTVINRRRVVECAVHIMRAGLIEEAAQELCSLETACAFFKLNESLLYLELLSELHNLLALENRSNERGVQVQDYLYWIKNDMSILQLNFVENCSLSCGVSQPLNSYPRIQLENLFADAGLQNGEVAGSEMKMIELLVSAPKSDYWLLCRVFGGRTSRDVLLTSCVGHKCSVTSISFNPDGARLVSGDEGGWIRVWDVATGSELNHWSVNESADVRWSPNGCEIAVLCAHQTLKLYEAVSYSEIEITTKHITFDYVRGFCWSSDSRQIAFNLPKNVLVWHRTSQRIVAECKSDNPNGYRCIACSKDGNLLAACSASKVCVFDISLNTLLSSIDLNESAAYPESVHWNHTSTGLIVNDIHFDPKLALLVDYSDIRSPVKTTTNLDGCTALCFGITGDCVVATGGPLCVIKLSDNSVKRELRGHTGIVKGAQVSSNNTIASFDAGGIRIWNFPELLDTTSQPQQEEEIIGHLEAISAIIMSPNGRYVATVGGKNLIVWDVASTAIQCRLFVMSNCIFCWNGSSDKLATISRFQPRSVDNFLNIYSIEGSLLNQVSCKKAQLGSIQPIGSLWFADLTWNSTDNLIAVAQESLIWVIDGIDFKHRSKLHPSPSPDFPHQIKNLAFCPNDVTKLAVVEQHKDFSWVNEVYFLLYEMATAQLIFRVSISQIRTNCRDPYPPNRTVMYWNNSASCVAVLYAGLVHLIDSVSGNVIRTLEMENQNNFSKEIFTVAWTPDDRHLVTSSKYERILRIWDAETGLQVGEHPGHPSSYLSGMAFTPDGKQLIVGDGESNVICSWTVVGQRSTA